MSRQVEGFILGVRYANEKVKYSRTYIKYLGPTPPKPRKPPSPLSMLGPMCSLADTDQARAVLFPRRKAPTSTSLRPMPTKRI